MEPIAKLGSSRGYGHTIGPAQRRLAAWVNGVPMTPGLPVDHGDSDHEGWLLIQGELMAGGMNWSAATCQRGHPDRHGFVGGAASAEDACDRAVEAILEEEADRLLLAAPPGLA